MWRNRIASANALRANQGKSQIVLPTMMPPTRKKAGVKKTAINRVKRPSDPTPVYFGKRLKTVREAAGLSQSELGRLVGIAQPDMPAIERGERDVRLSTANRLAHALGVHLCELLPPKS